MKKLGLALIAAVTISAPAFAADMRMPVKAAPIMAAPVMTWTGCYIGAGGGGAFETDDHYTARPSTGAARTATTTEGRRGWFGTVQAGCDYQMGNFVVGAFGDYDFMDVKGEASSTFVTVTGTAKQDWQWSVGGRVGYLVLPQLLTYVSGDVRDHDHDARAAAVCWPGGPPGRRRHRPRQSHRRRRSRCPDRNRRRR